MSTTLSKGFKKPQTGDSGATFFPDLEFDIQQTNDHTHDGNDSQKLSITSTLGYKDSSVGAGWAAVGDTYKKTVAIPAPLVSAGVTVDTINISLRDHSTGEIYSCLKIVRLSATSYDIYSIDNTLVLDAVYTA